MGPLFVQIEEACYIPLFCFVLTKLCMLALCPSKYFVCPVLPNECKTSSDSSSS